MAKWSQTDIFQYVSNVESDGKNNAKLPENAPDGMEFQIFERRQMNYNKY